MPILRDFESRAIRLTDERLQHILEHVVVRLTEADAFVVTAYLTDRIKKGRRVWPTEN